MKKIFYLILFRIFLQINSTAQNFWEPTNGPSGGEIEALTINSNNQIFASGWENGVFRSNDGGENWNPQNSGIAYGLSDVFLYVRMMDGQQEILEKLSIQPTVAQPGLFSL